MYKKQAKDREKKEYFYYLFDFYYFICFCAVSNEMQIGIKCFTALHLIIVIAATMLGVTRFSGNGSAAGHRSENPTVFTADTSDSVIASSIPALRSIFPGLNKYSGDFISVSTYKQKTGWHTLKFSVSSQSAVPESYAVRGKTCYININPDGSYARVLTAPCRSLLLDQQSTPGSKYRFILK
ncbi:hypothetical protein FTR14_04785 [Salmonella enterica]|nr:hypothetical protein [Salmonella enterica]